LSNEGGQLATLKAMALGFCGCSNFFILKLISCEFSSPPSSNIMAGDLII
jgi:hypothetical protein